METESSAAPASTRPRPILLILLGIVVAGLLLMRLGGSAGPDQPASNAARGPQQSAGDQPFDPAALDVDLESLEGERPGPGGSERNPFRFQPKAAPPAARQPQTSKPAPPEEQGPQEPQSAPVPPITVKFLGTMGMPDGSTRAVFTDCSAGGRRTQHYKEGESVLGQYRLVKIGLLSVVIEHLDGRGRTTLAKTGQDCVWK